ncbi:CRISPR-associated endoribonuclease Cas6 [Clostridium aminobutyricum]|uniref:CRISPR-associated endoribonuclease Cas6 n=1 Tax=Clostridium aminobutyricum TaxID=33953 RepID=A0A939D6B0_CLOAM|nr:CRISPR-associated endoribonuclease Cas6 [Clostridium aminobutyricum]MBN7771877.1 CRISPR-associated endoribonuclease Cas6 [Clostridium aminobutyricum]
MTYELNVKVYLLKDITINEMMGKIAALIDGTLGQDEEYLRFHKENKHKGYVFDGLYPVEREVIYHQGKIYTLRIRTVDSTLADYFEKYLFTAYTDEIKVLTVTKRLIPQKHIEKIYTLTPCVIKNDFGYWRGHMTIEDYERRIRENLIKNFNQFYGEKINENFELFTRVEFDNRKPISIPFKNNITLLGDKLTLYVSENEMAQSLTCFALGTGVGEGGSRGFGFCGYKYL